MHLRSSAMNEIPNPQITVNFVKLPEFCEICAAHNREKNKKTKTKQMFGPLPSIKYKL